MILPNPLDLQTGQCGSENGSDMPGKEVGDCEEGGGVPPQ